MAEFAEMQTALKRTVDSNECVSLEEAKAHCRVDGNDEDTWFRNTIKAARSYAEKYLKRQLLTGTWTLTLDRFPSDAILLRVCPVISVSSITYLDSNGTQQTLSTSLYRVDTTSEPARITPAYGQTWPVTYGVISQVVVTFTCGYGTTSESVPSAIKQAMLMMIGHAFDNRNAVASGNMVAVPLGVDSWLSTEVWSRVD